MIEKLIEVFSFIRKKLNQISSITTIKIYKN
jgi:hypothetical protein